MILLWTFMNSQSKDLLLPNRLCHRRGIKFGGESTEDEPMAAASPATPAPTTMTSNGHAA